MKHRACCANGYWLFQVGMDKCAGADTRLTYVTTGVLLQKLISAKHMNQYTHIILDEVSQYLYIYIVLLL